MSSIVNRTPTTLKSFFETGDAPTQAQFADLIDSFELKSRTTLHLKSIVGEDGMVVETNGYYTTNDCEPLSYVWDASSNAAEDGVNVDHPGLIIIPTGHSGSGRWIATPRNHVNVRWFGASPAEADNKPFFQRCADVVVTSSTLPRHIYIPGGIYNFNSGILFKRDVNADKNPEFFSILIQGEAGCPYGIVPYTRLNFTHTDTFGIGIQSGKGIRISNIELTGRNNFTFATPRLAFTQPETGYVINGCRDNPQSPYAGIVIDPFGSGTVVASPNRYPSYDAEYPTTHTGGGTTDVKIDDCRIAGFVTNICVSPNGQTQNSEQMEFNRIRTEQCKVAFAIGQLQSRSITIKDFTSWGNVLRLVDCSSYGQGGGQPPFISGGNMAGHMKYLMLCTGASVAQCRIENLFMESQYSIGNVSCDMLVFDGCMLKWSLPDASFATPHSYIAGAKQVKFDSCMLIHSANQPNSKPISLNIPRVSFVDCIFDVPPVSNAAFDSMHFERCFFRHIGTAISGTGSYFTTNGTTIANPPSNINGLPIAPGQMVRFSDRLVTHIGMTLRRENVEAATIPLTVGANGTASFTTAFPSRWSLASRGMCPVHILHFVADEYGVNMYPTGYVTSVVGNTVNLGGLPPQLTSGTYSIFTIFPFRYHTPCTGNTTNGSNVITNYAGAWPPQTTWRAGEMISGAGIPVGTFVTARDNAALTITLSQNCTATASNVDLFDAVVETRARTAAVPTTGAWTRGDVIDDSTGATNGWRCTASGTFGSANIPTFAAR